MRSALRASGAALVLIPSSSALASVSTAAAAAAAAVASDGGGGNNGDGDGGDGDGDGDNNSHVVLLGLAAAIAAEELSPVPWARSAFDDTRASAALLLAAGGWESRSAVAKAKYLSLGAAGAPLCPIPYALPQREPMASAHASKSSQCSGATQTLSCRCSCT